MGKVSEKRRATEESAPSAEQIAALEAKREVLLEELRRVEARIREVRESEPAVKSGCQAHAQGPEGRSATKPPPRAEKLERLLRERFPAEGREERIRRAKEHPLPEFGVGNLTPEQLKYFAEDVELEYDF